MQDTKEEIDLLRLLAKAVREDPHIKNVQVYLILMKWEEKFNVSGSAQNKG